MTSLELLTEAIKNKTSISFEYVKPEKIRGRRIGNPHAIYNYTSNEGVRSTKVHIVQTSGVSDSKLEKPLPDFRTFDLVDISNIELLENSPKFDVDHDYNPLWKGYLNVVVKI